jgi:TRAP-type C4-dicarboxylate transport system permease small subunit
MMAFIYKYRVALIVVMALLVAQHCLAIDLQSSLTKAGEELGQTADENTLPQKVGAVIKVITGILGILFVIFVVYAGIMWMTAGGDQGQVKKAKDYITNGVIGLIICLLAYALTTFIVDQITTNVLSSK